MSDRSGSGFSWTVILSATLLMTVLLSFNLGGNDLIGGDEGYYGVMARNILEDPAYIVNTSLSPMGPPGDKPFLYPLVLAGSLAAGGIGEVPMRLVTLLSAAAAGMLLMLIGGELGDRRAGMLAGLIYLFTPLLGNTGRIVSAEPLLVSLSLAGVWLVLAAIRRGRPGLGFLAGVLFGLAFLTKLWLVAIPMAGAAGWILYLSTSGRWRRVRMIAACTLAGFILFGSLQLLLCLIFSPGTFRHWLGIYTGFSLADRLAGGGFADYWHRPWHFYLYMIGRSFGQWLALIPLGLLLVLRKRKVSPAAAVTLSWLAPLLVLSAIPVKSGNYIMPFMPPLYLVAGYAASSLLPGGGEPAIAWREAWPAAAAGMLICLAAQIDFGGPGLRFHSIDMLRLQIVMTVAVLAAALPWRSRSVARSYAALALLVAAAAGLFRDVRIVRSKEHATGYREAARVLAPGLRDIDPRDPCFFSPEWPSVSFYTFRTGRYWESPYQAASPGDVISSLEGGPYFYLIPESPGLYGGAPGDRELAGIEERAVLVESGAPGDRIRLRVYVNASLHESLYR
jgi:4-amino-4-deoxy-L-arabinose transferase-like glycosyltransferase